jgi:hypothetical protein
MPLLGRAAMLLTFDLAPEAEQEHDDWHTHEHLPERLAIPGFLRGSRWLAARGAPRTMVLYEVRSLETLVSPAYLQRLNAPTPWTQKLMPSYRGMTRGLCAVVASLGAGLGRHALLIRFDADAGARPALTRWLAEVVMPPLPSQPGVAGAHLLEAGMAAPMTREQSIRGADRGLGMALLVTGYRLAGLEAVAQPLWGAAGLQAHGAAAASSAFYEIDATLAAQELAA